MKPVHKAFKFRLYPDREQMTLLAKHFGCCRLLYNHFLYNNNLAYEKEKLSFNYYDNAKTLTLLKKEEAYHFLNEINSQSMQSSLKHLDTAKQRFFRKQAKFPRYRSKYGEQSFTVPQSITVKDAKLQIPKFREGIKIKVHRKIEGRILSAALSRSTVGKYYVSLTCEIEHESFPKTGSHVGVDTGIKDLAILSNGTVYKNIKPLRTNLKKLKHEDRQLSKKRKGSNSYVKQKKKRAVRHEKVVNIRKDHLHKASTEIIKNHDVICIEDLAIKNLMKNHNLAQAFADVSLGAFYAMLKYKAAWNNKTIVKIDRFFPSSKSCSSCGYIKQDLRLSDRSWTCGTCNTVHDRDLNASINIKKEGLKLLSGLGAKSEKKQKRREALPLGESMNSEAHSIAEGVDG